MIKYSLLQAKLNIAKEINLVVGRRGRSFRATEAKAAAGPVNCTRFPLSLVMEPSSLFFVPLPIQEMMSRAFFGSYIVFLLLLQFVLHYFPGSTAE